MICCVCGYADDKRFQFDLVDKFVERGGLEFAGLENAGLEFDKLTMRF